MSRRDRAFTIVEVMLVLGLIAVLVAIAVPIYLNATENSRRSAAKNSLATAEAHLETLWNDRQSASNFCTNHPLVVDYTTYDFLNSRAISSGYFARTLSVGDTKNSYLRVYVVNTTTLRLYQKYRNYTQVEGSIGEDLERADNTICVVQGRCYLSSGAMIWGGDTTTHAYITLVVKAPGSSKAYFASYYRGVIQYRGEFDWTQASPSSQGTTTNFVRY